MNSPTSSASRIAGSVRGAIDRLQDAIGVWAWVPVLVVGAFLRLFRLTTVPAGMLNDEGFNSLDIIQILDGARPVFLSTNFGREALFIYFQAASVAAFGHTDWSLRVVSASAGILTLVATYVLVRRLFGTRVAFITMCLLSVSLWHVMFSRIGLRTISLPLIGTVAFYCLWRGFDGVWSPGSPVRPSGWRAERPLVWFAIAGVSIGVAQYTYTAARFLPIVVLIFAAYLVVTRPKLARRALPGLFVAAFCAVAVFAPEGWYFLRHPSAFVTRAEAVSVFNTQLNGGSWADGFAYSVQRTLGMFSFLGDEEWDRNIPGRPIFDPASSVFLALGLLISLRRWREPRYAFILAWLLILLVPSMISIRDVPNFLRVTGVIPSAFVLPALGAVAVWDLWNQRTANGARAVPVIALFVGLSMAAVGTYQDYFGSWAHAPGVSYYFNADRWLAIASARPEAAATGKPVLVGAGEPDAPMQRFALTDARTPGVISVFNGARSLIFPRGAAPQTYVFSPRDLPSAELIERYLTLERPRIVTAVPDGRSILAYESKGRRTEFAPDHPVAARFSDEVKVVGFDVPRDVRAGESLQVRWYWEILQPVNRELAFFNQAVDQNGKRRGQLDDRAFAPGYWPSGTTGISTFDVPIDRDAPTGVYSILAGVYDRSTMDRLLIRDGTGQSAGTQLVLGPVKVHGVAPLIPPPSRALSASFADAIGLAGYDLTPDQPRAGENVQLTLHWTARGRPTHDYTVFVHVLNSANAIVAQADSPPVSGRSVTSLWDGGDLILDPHDVRLPASLTAGPYRLEVGLYAAGSGERLSVVQENRPGSGDSIVFDGPTVR